MERNSRGESKNELDKYGVDLSENGRKDGPRSVAKKESSFKSLKSKSYLFGSKQKCKHKKEKEIKPRNFTNIKTADADSIVVSHESHLDKQSTGLASSATDWIPSKLGKRKKKSKTVVVSVNNRTTGKGWKTGNFDERIKHDKKKSKSLWIFHPHKKKRIPRQKTNGYHCQPSSDTRVSQYYKSLQEQTVPLVYREDFLEEDLNVDAYQSLSSKPEDQQPRSGAQNPNGCVHMTMSSLQMQAEDAISHFDRIMSAVFFSPSKSPFISNKQTIPEVSPEYVIQLIDEVLSVPIE